MAQLNTRIVLRNDTTAAWGASTDPVLLKGEVGIEFDPSVVTAEGIKADYKVKMKIGDGITPWSGLPYFGNDIEVNEDTFVLGENQVLELYGFVDAETGAQLTKGEDGKLAWVVPSTERVDSIEEKLNSLQQKINPTDEDGNPIEGGLESDIENLKESLGLEEIKDESGNVTQEATGIYKEIKETKTHIETVETAVNELATLVGSNGEEPSGIFAVLNELAAEAEVNAQAIETEKGRAEAAEKKLSDDIGLINEALGEVYTKTEVHNYVAGQIGSAGHLKRLVVDVLPEGSKADPDIIYMILKESDFSLTDDYYEEYMYIDNKWEKIGNTYVNLEPYATTEYVDGELAKKANSDDVYIKSEVDDLLNSKASQSDLETLSGKVDQKAESSVLEALSKTVADNKTAVDGELAKKLEADALAPYALTQDVANSLSQKADKATTLAGYEIGDAYTKTEIDELIGLPAVYNDEGEVTSPATGIYTNIYTRQEVRDLISDVTGESASGVLDSLNDYIGTNDTRVKTIEDKVNGIEDGAQVNVIEAIKLEGEENVLEVVDKTVTILNATTERAGIVKLSNEVGVDSNGNLEIKSINANKLNQTEGEWLILNGGTSASV